jgi:PIN domain nuclease of toxin-antitoxin system
VSGVLLDTHVWLWYAEGLLDKLSAQSIKALERARRGPGLSVSPISIWEIGMLQQKGRIQLSTPPRQWIERAIEAPGIRCLPLDAAAALESTLLPGLPLSDPADRLLIAIARVERLALATRDEQILEYSRAGFLRTLAI